MSTTSRPYTVTPLYVRNGEVQFGCQIDGIELSKNVSNEVVKQIKDDVRDHRVVVFKNQGILLPERHLEIAKWFGELESTFYNHPKSPDRDIFRVSNDKNEGCTNVGRTGWHIDGSFQEKPFSNSVMHIINVPKLGATCFIPLTQLLEGVEDEKRKLWDRLWMVSDRRSGPVHPVIYRHPLTGKPVMCLHLGMTEGFILDHGTEKAKATSPATTRKIMDGIYEELVKEGGSIQFHHRWEEGDLVITDNLAVAHEADPDTQLPREQVGLRVMHRVTVKGKTIPKK